MRLNKYISETGICSRREADTWIDDGRVTINGLRANVGTQVEAGDVVKVDGHTIKIRQQKHVYIALNKPVGITCTSESHIKDNIVSFVGHDQRIFPIGRLDKESDGLILLTSDGDIVNTILRSEHNHEKEYIVTVNKTISNEFVTKMARGVRILDTVTKRCKVQMINKYTFRITLTQGLNRQIRRMCEAFGYRVCRLQRVRIINIRLGHLKIGHWRNLTKVELAGLLPNKNHSVSSKKGL